MPDMTLLPESDLVEFVTAQPWFSSRPAEPPSARILETVEVRDVQPRLVLAIVEVDVEHGRSELYQLPIGLRPADESWTNGVIGAIDDWTAYDALFDPILVGELQSRVASHLAV